MTKREWLEIMLPHAVRGLKDQEGFGISSPQTGQRLMWSFDGSYRTGGRPDATRYEIGARAWRYAEEGS